MAKFEFLDGFGRIVANEILRSLRFFLNTNRRKAVLIAVVLGLFGCSYWMLPGMGYLPNGGTNLIKVQVETAEGTSLDENSRLMKILEDRWKQIKGVRHIVATPSRTTDRNVIFLLCDKEEESGVPIEQIAGQLTAISSDLPFKAVNPIQFPLFGNINTRSNIVNIWVNGANYKVIEDIIKQVMEIGQVRKELFFTIPTWPFASHR